MTRQSTRKSAAGAERLLDNSAYLVMDVGRLLRRNFDVKMKSLGLSRSEWYLIAHLVFFDGSTQQELADVLDVSKGGMAKLIDKLEERGLVRRAGESHAGHVVKRVFLTAEGRKLALTVDDASVKTVDGALSVLTDAQHATLNSLLQQLRAGLMQEERQR